MKSFLELFSKKDLSSIIGLATFTIICGIFFGNSLFGDRSLLVYYKLKKERNILRREIHDLKLENAFLQKGILELKSVDPDITKLKF